MATLACFGSLCVLRSILLDSRHLELAEGRVGAGELRLGDVERVDLGRERAAGVVDAERVHEGADPAVVLGVGQRPQQ